MELDKYKKTVEEETYSKVLEQLSTLKQEALDLHKQTHADLEELVSQRADIVQEHANLQLREQIDHEK